MEVKSDDFTESFIILAFALVCVSALMIAFAWIVTL